MGALSDADLSDLEHENFIAVFRAVGPNASRYLDERDSGVALIATGLPIRLFNQILVEDANADPAAIGRAVDRMRALGYRFAVDLRQPGDEAYVQAARGAGLEPLSETPWMPGMAWSPLPAPGPGAVPLPAGGEIRRIDGASGIEDHLAVVAAAFELPESIVREIISVRLLDRAEITTYVGYLDGAPVAAGLGCRTGRTIGVYNIATIESARGRGFGAAMTVRVVTDGQAEGCDVAILQASDMGYPIYERLGFRTVVDYVGYVDPEPTADPEPRASPTPAG